MRLSRIIEGSGLACPPGSDPEITAVVHDSRRVVPGSLFVCLPGGTHDGHRFAAQAVAEGAVAVIAERPVEVGDAVLLLAPSSRQALAHCALRFAGDPHEALRLVGITGTNGKTTVSFLFDTIAREAGLRPGLIGTLGHWADGEQLSAGERTTPDAAEIARHFAAFRAHGCDLAVMEVSSHALVQERVAKLAFDTAVFTGLSRDHLDFHGDMESYFAAKVRLFTEHLDPAGQAIVNGDDPWGRRLLAQLPGAWRFSAEDASADLYARDMELDIEGIRAWIETPKGAFFVRSPLVGLHNLQNMLAATGIALALGIELSSIEAGLSQARGAPGRLERIEAAGISVFVDFAHTDDALRRSIASLRAGAPRRLLVVFGCGGERDVGKRELMGEAATGADLVVVTSDNPRREDPEAIARAILPGLERGGMAPITRLEAEAGESGYLVELNRREAIDAAIRCAGPGDAVLIAGKGHEVFQIVGTESLPFDDRDEARRALALHASANTDT